MHRNLFVYGTLRKGLQNSMSRFLRDHADYVGEGYCRGRLYDLGGFPGLQPSHDPDDRVVGEVYALRQPESALAHLDEYEGCVGPDPLYRRKLVEVIMSDGEPIQAWAYIFNRPVSDFKRIASGDYLYYISS